MCYSNVFYIYENSSNLKTSQQKVLTDSEVILVVCKGVSFFVFNGFVSFVCIMISSNSSKLVCSLLTDTDGSVILRPGNKYEYSFGFELPQQG